VPTITVARRQAMTLQLHPELVLTIAICISFGRVFRGPIREYESEESNSLGGCHDLRATYRVVGHATDHARLFVVPPIWWERTPTPPRLGQESGLRLRRGAPVEIEGAGFVTLTQPDEDRLVITILDESGRAMEDWGEIVFAHRDGETPRLGSHAREFFCRSARLSFGWYDECGEAPGYSAQRTIGRHLDGSLLVHARSSGSTVAGFIPLSSRDWHHYEEAPSRELAPE
jgi:hypothetical protein